MGLVFIIAGAITTVVVLRWLWRGATTDWFGIHYEDKSSPYYHDKTGQGKGHRP